MNHYDIGDFLVEPDQAEKKGFRNKFLGSADRLRKLTLNVSDAMTGSIRKKFSRRPSIMPPPRGFAQREEVKQDDPNSPSKSSVGAPCEIEINNHGQLEASKDVINFEVAGVKLPVDGLLETLIAKGQHAIGIDKKGMSFQTTYSFAGWKIDFENFFTRAGDLFCLGVTPDLNFIVEAKCTPVYKPKLGSDKTAFLGVICELTNLISTARFAVEPREHDLSIVNLGTDAETVYKVVSSDYRRDEWMHLDVESSLCEMKIQIILDNFQNKLHDNSTFYFLKSAGAKLHVSRPSSPLYEYQFSSETEDEVENPHKSAFTVNYKKPASPMIVPDFTTPPESLGDISSESLPKNSAASADTSCSSVITEL